MPETFAQYLEKWLKQSTAQGLNNPLVKMPVEHLRREPEAPLMTRHPSPPTRACDRGIKRFRLLQPNAIVLVITILLTSTWLTSCAIPITYHDAATYKNLTDLKAEAVMLVETFDTKPFAANEAAIADLTLKFRKAHEYEKGKGKPNSDTMRQFDEVWKLLNEDLKDYRENGNATLGPKYFQEAARVLGQAFDIAIATENLKNMDK